MNRLLFFAIVLCCSVIMAVKASLLMSQGVSLFMALLVLYLAAVAFMLSLQHRARQSWDTTQEYSDSSEPESPEAAATRTSARLTIV